MKNMEGTAKQKDAKSGPWGNLRKRDYIFGVIIVALISQITTNIFTSIWNAGTNTIASWSGSGKPYVDIIAVNQQSFGTVHTVYLLNSGNGSASNINFDIGLPNQSVKIINITGLSPNLKESSILVPSPMAHSPNYTEIGISGLGVKRNASFDVVLNMPADITINNAKVNSVDNESCVSYLEQTAAPLNLTQKLAQYEYSFSNLGVCNIAEQFPMTFIIGNITRRYVNGTILNVTPLNMSITFNGFRPDQTENIYMALYRLGNET